MTSRILLTIAFSFISYIICAQSVINETPMVLKTEVGELYGILKVPQSKSKIPVAVIIAGSGPTDRDGNQPQMKSNSLKMLSDGLYYKGIATLCFDKRKSGKSKVGQKEEDIRLEDFVKDVEGWIDLVSQDKRFSDIIIIGHSEGSLIGMLAINNRKKIDRFISLAGSGKPKNEILKEQLSERMKGQPQFAIDMIFSYIEKLERGERIPDVPQNLMALFRPSVQPYLISCFKYNPQAEIAKINIPVLITSGSTDIQVTPEHTELLSKANPKAHKVIIENMNHILKECDKTDLQSQLATYTDPNKPIMEQITNIISSFIKGN
ncbi:MAG: alpha/beta hydrolase [Dysgonomonas sp.]|nr:alpha/beta hydrolase [Dysgonomonas sp.]